MRKEKKKRRKKAIATTVLQSEGAGDGCSPAAGQKLGILQRHTQVPPHTPADTCQGPAGNTALKWQRKT